ncbi:MAG: AEC family transporter [Alphaproteobacteria bacterium]|nr:AEC family transporter [Alphaproteobacteria bacterium]
MQAILTVAFPIFAMILTGYLAGRLKILGAESTAALNAFVSYFALPVLFFGTLARTPVQSVFDAGFLAGFSLVFVASYGFGMLMNRLVKRGGLAEMNLHGLAAAWGNVGYMGVPLALAAFGAEGLPPAMLAVIVTAVFSMVIGVMMIELGEASDEGAWRGFVKALSGVARNPLPLSILAGLAASWIGLKLPGPIDRFFELMGAAAAPCALFAIGLFLADKAIGSGVAEAGLVTLNKLLLQPLLAFLILPFFVPLDSVAGKVGLLMAALPTAANAFVLAKQYEISVEENTAAVLLSTAISVITVSALLVWMRVG